MTVGERIHTRRLELGLSQRELACERRDLRAYISRLEANARTPSVKALRKLAAKVDVSAHWLETGQPDPPNSSPSSYSTTTAAPSPLKQHAYCELLRDLGHR
jgi:transcriptional regulator with XRE-family HTH domain